MLHSYRNPRNTPRVFHVETMWKRPCVCRKSFVVGVFVAKELIDLNFSWFPYECNIGLIWVKAARKLNVQSKQ